MLLSFAAGFAIDVTLFAVSSCLASMWVVQRRRKDGSVRMAQFDENDQIVMVDQPVNRQVLSEKLLALLVSTILSIVAWIVLLPIFEKIEYDIVSSIGYIILGFFETVIWKSAEEMARVSEDELDEWNSIKLKIPSEDELDEWISNELKKFSEDEEKTEEDKEEKNDAD